MVWPNFKAIGQATVASRQVVYGFDLIRGFAPALG